MAGSAKIRLTSVAVDVPVRLVVESKNIRVQAQSAVRC